ncbi:hypothetical protein, partial [Bathymodiolus thermophilus thioautotrophic gill symbiont]
MIKTIKNIQALSGFKQEGLNKKLATLNIKLSGVEFVHFADCTHTLTATEREVLSELLSYEAPFTEVNETQIIVIPRLGTISPWSSKASDIL